MSTLNAALEMRPEAFDGVGVRRAANVFASAVIDPTVHVAHAVKAVICNPFLGTHGCALCNVRGDDRFDSLSRSIVENLT